MSESSSSDERAIRNLVASYCHAISERDDAAWAETWDEDAEWRVLGQRVRGRDAILAHYQKLIGGLDWVVQLAHDGLVELEGDSASGRWQITEHLKWKSGQPGLNVGRYRDRYVRRADGRWRFATRDFQPIYLGPPDLSAPSLDSGPQGTR